MSDKSAIISIIAHFLKSHIFFVDLTKAVQ